MRLVCKDTLFVSVCVTWFYVRSDLLGLYVESLGNSVALMV